MRWGMNECIQFFHSRILVSEDHKETHMDKTYWVHYYISGIESEVQFQ